MKIFLDDVRIPLDCISYMHQRIGTLNPIYQEKWIIVKNYDQFKVLIDSCVEKNVKVTHVSFDHDLADEHYDPIMLKEEGDYNSLYNTFKEKTGLDCAKYLNELYIRNELELPIMFVHSMNPVGTQNIINVFK